MTAATSASTTSASTRLARWRESATSLNLRQRSEVSLSLASVLVMSVKRRRLAPSVAARALAAVSLIFASGSMSLPSSGSSVRLSPSKSNRSAAIVASNKRFHAAAALTDLSRNNRSRSSASWCGFSLADALDPRAIMAKRRRPHGGVQFRIVEAIELELEKQDVAGKRGHALLRVAIKLRDCRIACVGGVEQRRVRHDAASQVLQRLVSL